MVSTFLRSMTPRANGKQHCADNQVGFGGNRGRSTGTYVLPLTQFPHSFVRPPSHLAPGVCALSTRP